MLFSLLIILIMFLMSLTFFVGLILFIFGRLKKDKNNKLTKVGLILLGIPTSIIILFLLLSLISEIFSSKPDEEDLVGTYHIVKVTQVNFDKNIYSKVKLQFYKGGRFTLTPTPNIDICESGKYKVDYKWDYNELSLECPASGFTSAHIDRGFGSFRIEFIIGDPDSGESIYFEKNND